MGSEQNEKGITERVKKNPEDEQEDGKISVKGNMHDFSCPSSSFLEFDIDQKGAVVQSPLDPSASPMNSPPVQTMGHPEGYDPNRIPSSIFSSKPSNPAEWSSTSNESLFSIHMGNNSFTHEFGKSGEFAKLDELNQIPVSGELFSLPPVMEVPGHEDSGALGANVDNRAKEKTDHTDQAVRLSGAATTNAPDQSLRGLHIETNSSVLSPPRTSDESGHSGHSSISFAFPVLVSDAGKAASASLGAMDRSEKNHEEPEKQNEKSEKSEKPELKEQASNPTTPQETSNPSATGWSCLFCWSRCC